MKFEYLVSIRSLKVKYEQCVDNGGMRSTANVTDLRRRPDERCLEKEEEAYFNEESDDEDTSSASISQNQKGQQQKPVLSNGVAAGYSLSSRSGALVDYDDDEDDEDYRPPQRKQLEASEENEGTMESLRLKRKLPSKDKEPDLVKKQKLSKNSKSKDSVFATLCSTLSQAVLPGKRTAMNIHTDPCPNDGRESSGEGNQEKGPSVSEACSEISNTTNEENHLGKETASSRNVSERLHGNLENGQLGAEEHPLVSPKSSPEMAVNGS
ncbi:hypothetical protein PIB30_081461 [Stylosanthes scabra]|uniref:Uncharacterized protein n=1 Tax=Stylosanthes scabra TaxID=79078 RepID=A0ABU6YSH6_9FABA|nr:hypothetical protein [Stylosanthes scabra]